MRSRPAFTASDSRAQRTRHLPGRAGARAASCLVAAGALLAGCVRATGPVPDAPRSQYEKANAAADEGHLDAAKAILDGLIESHPGYFEAYPLRWSVVGRMAAAEDVRRLVKPDLERLEKAAADRPDDDLYEALVSGSRWLADEDRVKRWEAEAIARLPRGRIARAERLRLAEKEEDPVRAASIYQELLAGHGGDSQERLWALSGRFDVLAGHPDRFTPRELLEGARRFEQFVASPASPQGDPFLYVDTLLRISSALAERQPVESLESAARGLAYVEKTWPTTVAVDETDGYRFWPIMMRAYGASGDWRAARRVGARLMETLDSGGFGSLNLKMIDESAVRKDYALALERTGAVDEAREQIGLAALLGGSARQEAEAFSARHPVLAAERAVLEKRLSAAWNRLMASRESMVKRELLASEENAAAPGFVLQDTTGRKVSLESFRGRTLVLSFWATWCGPCRKEMKGLEAAYRKYRGDGRVAFAAVSIDEDKSRVPPFIREHEITLPVLLTDGSVESVYIARGIPALYLIDARGRIRFRRAGWLDDGYDPRRLDWMIEAARRSP